MWLLIGHTVFGFLTGLLTGLSQSPIVSAVLPLVFSFGGGSVLALSVGESMTPAGRELVGMQLFAFSLGSLAGLALGIYLRKTSRADLPLLPRKT